MIISYELDTNYFCQSSSVYDSLAADNSLDYNFEYEFQQTLKLGVEVISKDAEYSYYYARNVLRGRFELGETTISKDSLCSVEYARDVIHDRFHMGEESISTDARCSYIYALEILKNRFVLGEPSIKTSYLAYDYENFLKTVLTPEEFVLFKLEY